MEHPLLQTVRKPDDVLDLGPVGIDAVRALVGRLGDAAWDRLDAGKENDFFCFHDTKHIIFRFVHGNRDARDVYDTPAWPIWRHVLQPLMDDVAARYGFVRPVFPKVMLARLAAGQRIDRHTDGAGSNLQTHKIHVPLSTNPDVVFEVGEGTFRLAEGRAYEVNNLVPHAVRNGGETDRVHLIFEVCDAGG